MKKLAITALGFACALALTGRSVPAQTGPRLAAYFTEIPFTPLDPTYGPRQARSLENADLDGDGNQDIVILGQDPSSGKCCTPQPGRVFLGDGDGHFVPAPADLFPIDTLLTVQVATVLFADFNADGRPDMFLNSEGWDTDPYVGEQNRLYLSVAEGGWRDATATLPQVSDAGVAAAVGDISGRGLQDVFVANTPIGVTHVNPYMLMNTGGGQFLVTRSNIPSNGGQILDPYSNRGASLQGATLGDVNGDGLPELIVTGRAKSSLRTETIFWNRSGVFVETDTTELPAPVSFPETRMDMDAQRIDVNLDGLQDLVLVGTQQNYQGWFVQILVNKGNRQFMDETAVRVPAGEFSGNSNGISPVNVQVLDFNQDGAPDFFPRFLTGSRGMLPQDWPIVWLNDGTGHFITLKVGDFVPPGKEQLIGSPHLIATRNGYSFFTTTGAGGGGRLALQGLLATKPHPTLSLALALRP
jgi:hypothetical protein